MFCVAREDWEDRNHNFCRLKVPDHDNYGIFVVDRRYKSCNDSIQQLADCLFGYCTLTRRQRVILRNRTERLSELLDWKTLGSVRLAARAPFVGGPLMERVKF